MEIPVGSVLTALAAVVAVVVSNLLTSRSSNREKLWDLRREGYGVVLFELAAVERICDIADEYIAEVGFMSYWETKERERYDSELRKRMKTIRDRVASDYLVFSDLFLKEFGEFDKESRADEYNSLPDEEHEVFCAAIRKFRPRLSALCRAEMKISTA